MISVLILTLNEEKNILKCLESVSWSDDIVVLDSFSTDQTVDIAVAFGARVYQRKFDSEAGQRRHSVSEIHYKYPWVYNPDADEIPTPELIQEMKEVVASDVSSQISAYRVRFKTIFLGRWIKHSSLYPTWVVRLFRPEKLLFNREVNLNYVVDGNEARLNEHFLHYTFNNGFDAWFNKHNSYSKYEAIESIKSIDSASFSLLPLFGFSGGVAKRRVLKELSFRIPCRPLFRFFYMYIIRFGFLDGMAGFHYCCMLSVYEYMIVLKMLEFRRRANGFSV